MDDLIDTETAHWLLARLPRPIVITLIILKMALLHPFSIMAYLLAILFFIVYRFQVWGIVFIGACIILLIFVAVYVSIDDELPKREKKQDENQSL